MAEWKIARFDPSYGEPIDPEIIPLCDALNAAGFPTTQSCCGHGHDWARVWFENSHEMRIEKLARFVLATELLDYGPHFTLWQKEIRLTDCHWCLEIHCNDVYANTPPEQALAKAVQAMAFISNLIWQFQPEEKMCVCGHRPDLHCDDRSDCLARDGNQYCGCDLYLATTSDRLRAI